MKLPRFYNTVYDSRYNSAYAYRAAPGMRSVYIQADNADNVIMGDIYACTRPIRNSPFGTHCYLVVSRNGGDVDSIGVTFRGSEREQHRNAPGTTCALVKANASELDWATVKAIYANRPGYNVRSNNCCTVAQRAILEIGANVPAIVTRANDGVGTTNQCVLM